MPYRIAAACSLVAFVALAPSTALAGTEVTLRIEGSSATTFERAVMTGAKPVRNHRCDGTNNGAHPSPGATATGALDDGAAGGAFSWTGTWHDSFEDFFVTRIGPDSRNDNAYWGIAVNHRGTSAGGCQTRVLAGDEVLFGYDFFSKQHILKLTAPWVAKVGQPFRVKVVDGQDDSPIGGASVGGKLTGIDGTATLSYGSPGVHRLKAEHPASVRSNAAFVCAYQSSSRECESQLPASGPSGGGAPSPGREGETGGRGGGTHGGEGSPLFGKGGKAPTATSTGPFERVRPRARISSQRHGRRYRRGPRVVRGVVAEYGSGIEQVHLRLLRRHGKRCRWYSVRQERFMGESCRGARFSRIGRAPKWSIRFPARLQPGSYELRVRAVDRAGNRDSSMAKRRTMIRFKVRSRRGTRR